MFFSTVYFLQGNIQKETDTETEKYLYYFLRNSGKKNSTVNTLLSNHFKGLTMHDCLLAFFFSKQGNVTVAQFFQICWILIENTFSQRHDNNKDTRISELLIYIIELKNQFSMNYSA